MQVKVGNNIFDSDKLPIMLLLSDEEKQQLANMPEDLSKYCSYNPKIISAENIRRWMEMSFTAPLKKLFEKGNENY